MSRGSKRRLSEDEEMYGGGDSDFHSYQSRTEPSDQRKSPFSRHAEIKRLKTGSQRRFPISRLLTTMDKDKLVHLINGLIDAHPFIQEDIAQIMPSPTLQTASSTLAELEKKMNISYPYNRGGPGKDDYSFNRVRPALMDLVSTLTDFAEHFTQPSEFPTTSFSYLHIATCVVHRLPAWDTESHNNIKRDAYVSLSGYWKRVIRQASDKVGDGKIYGQQVVSEWAKNLAQHNTVTNGLFSSAIEEFTKQLGWIIGLHSGPEPFWRQTKDTSLATAGSPAIVQAGFASSPLSMFKSPTQSPPGTPSSSSSSVLNSSGSGSRYSRPPSVVIETLHAKTSENSAGQKKINQYTLEKEIGHGAFGTVHIAVDTSGNVYAIKEFSKSRLRKKEQSDMLRRSGPRGRGRGRVGLGVGRAASAAAAEPKNPLDLVRGEMAILKKLNHENVVKLYEFLDDPNDDSLYMVFEMAEKGALMDVDLDKVTIPYSEEESRIYFRQMILGIEYLHHNEIAHRDIKPDNLLRSKDDILKIVDFGVSEMFDKGNDRLKKSAGSPAFMAPELCVARHGDVSGTAADIWSMGVTLYCLIYGRLPFPKSNMVELFEAIKNDPVPYESGTNPKLLDLLQKMLTKDPSQRITMDQMRVHPWVTNDGSDPLISVDENCQLVVTEVTDEEFSNAIKSVANIFTVMKAVTKFKRHSRSMSQQSLKSMSEQEPRKEPRTDIEAKHQRHSTADDETHLAVEGLERDTRRLSIEQS